MNAALTWPAVPALSRQSYGIASGQNKFGGPRGVWLECRACPESQRIEQSNSEEWMATPDRDVAAVFRHHGWTGQGDKMLGARCPACSQRLGPDLEPRP